MEEKTYSSLVSRVDKSKKKKRRLKKSVNRLLSFVLFLIILGLTPLLINITKESVSTSSSHPSKEVTLVDKTNPIVKDSLTTTIKVSAAGDFTLGRDESYPFEGSFDEEAMNNGYGYFVEGIEKLFKEDDFTSVNLETTLTTATEKAEKTFRFKGDPSYAQILNMAGIDAVNLANNHMFDYLQEGYEDTKHALKLQQIGYFGYENTYMTTVKGIKIGALGYEGWQDSEELRRKIKGEMNSLREQGAQIVIIHFHWGEEKQYVPNESQKSLARFSVDHGADLIIGHHPHVIQGIEEYKEKFIVYSLGNFMFGGNKNPTDKDTFVFQQTFYIENGYLTNKKDINVLPFSISSVTHRNNYQPVPLVDQENERVKNKIIQYSNHIDGASWVAYE
ncbi:CapA family protein [Bacillus weihaiensis]|uniref:Capsular biosynthesis protein n=1 Tax=Bacillus weihaiensis TaxID=1547283 RepID=A0A1L3MQW3_9BACI|nr:CapA family protein [Bacillus weihaiensis]APH04721.1 capsular biosynthesis protein [Bacillus weihaiensis]